MKVKIEFGTIRQGDVIYGAGDEIDILESKLPRFGSQVSRVVEESTPLKSETPPVDPPKEPEQPPTDPPAEESGKKKGKNSSESSESTAPEEKS